MKDPFETFVKVCIGIYAFVTILMVISMFIEYRIEGWYILGAMAISWIFIGKSLKG